MSLVIRTVGPSVGWWKGRERQRESDVGMRVEREPRAAAESSFHTGIFLSSRQVILEYYLLGVRLDVCLGHPIVGWTGGCVACFA